uniref:Uncharacterized protein n=1 Tax=Sphaerodactylus townsendi TaxID=933632 RepID=A0ACB8FEB8_9SAUR
MGRQSAAGGRSIPRSQSRSSLSASFEALAGYFPCMNSLQEEEEREEEKTVRGAFHVSYKNHNTDFAGLQDVKYSESAI